MHLFGTLVPVCGTSVLTRYVVLPVEYGVDAGGTRNEPRTPHVDLFGGRTANEILRVLVEFTELEREHVDQHPCFTSRSAACLPLGDQLICCRHRSLLHVRSQRGSKIDKPVHRCDADSQNIRENRHQPPLVQGRKVIGPFAHPARRILAAGAFSNDTNVSRATVLGGRARISRSSITVRSSSR